MLRGGGWGRADAIEREPGMPGRDTVAEWRRRRPEFAVLYEAALAQRAADARRRREDRRKSEAAAAGTAAGRIGRPPLYTPELGEKVCQLIEAGASMAEVKLCRELPSYATIYTWIGQDPAFRARYQAACEVRAEVLAEQVLEIADDGAGDWVDGARGGRVVDREHIQRSKVRIEARKWRIAMIAPKTHGLKRLASEPEGLTFEQALKQLRERSQL